MTGIGVSFFVDHRAAVAAAPVAAPAAATIAKVTFDMMMICLYGESGYNPGCCSSTATDRSVLKTRNTVTSPNNSHGACTRFRTRLRNVQFAGACIKGHPSCMEKLWVSAALVLDGNGAKRLY